jgi:hypothetical protein|tara:strand:+ start:233 stop:487 length:255 start_codon:yes stop_codon:yes gene_type:complete
LLVNALVELNQDLPTVTNITLPDDHSASTSTKSSSLTSRDGATPIKGMPETQQRERTKREQKEQQEPVSDKRGAATNKISALVV